MGHIAEAEVESGRVFAQRLVRWPYLEFWDASWPDSGRGIAELEEGQKAWRFEPPLFDRLKQAERAPPVATDGAGVARRSIRGSAWAGDVPIRASLCVVSSPKPSTSVLT